MWTAQGCSGSVAELHALDVLGAPNSVWRMSPTRGAVVLGSAQRDDVVSASAVEAQGLDLCRRRSGGGLVLVDPARMVWLDVVVPVGDERWHDDVHRAFLWLGETWVDALATVGIEASVHRDAAGDPELGRLVCFAGMGAGEVHVEGRKVVGLSQRRDRRGARFQCMVHREWDPVATLAVLGPATAERRDALVARLTDGVGSVAEVDRVVDAVTERILSS